MIDTTCSAAAARSGHRGLDDGAIGVGDILDVPARANSGRTSMGGPSQETSVMLHLVVPEATIG
jgi:hypothetical protein